MHGGRSDGEVPPIQGGGHEDCDGGAGRGVRGSAAVERDEFEFGPVRRPSGELGSGRVGEVGAVFGWEFFETEHVTAGVGQDPCAVLPEGGDGCRGDGERVGDVGLTDDGADGAGVVHVLADAGEVFYQSDVVGV